MLLLVWIVFIKNDILKDFSECQIIVETTDNLEGLPTVIHEVSMVFYIKLVQGFKTVRYKCW